MKEKLISLEVAEEQLQEFLDVYEIEASDFGAGEDGEEGLASVKRQLLKGLCYGRLEVVDDAQNGLTLKQNLANPLRGVESLTYRLTGAAKAAIKAPGAAGKKEGDAPFAAMFRFAAALCGEDVKVFYTMGALDMRTAQAVATLFLSL
jgi:hypothetical protein